jgi:hypothetical protein
VHRSSSASYPATTVPPGPIGDEGRWQSASGAERQECPESPSAHRTSIGLSGRRQAGLSALPSRSIDADGR